MSIRNKGRNTFDFNGRLFSWWIDDDRWLRIASIDKRFIVAVPLGRDIDETPSIQVIGPEFLGILLSERPQRVEAPEFFSETMGRTVELVLGWCFSSNKEVVIIKGL